MVFEFKLPDIGEGIHEGEIVRWLVAAGEAVKENQPIVEVMTDKATVELTAPRTGRIGALKAKEGEVVTVGSVIVTIEEGAVGAQSKAGAAPARAAAGAAPPAAKTAAPPPKPHAPVAAPPGAAKAALPAAKFQAAAAEGPKEEKTLFDLPPDAVGARRKKREGAPSAPSPGGNGAPSGAPPGRVLATPATRKLARELGVDIARVSGSGLRGRVTKDDVKGVASGPATTIIQRPAPSAAPPPAARTGPLEERIPVKGLRRAISKAMAASHGHVVPFTYVEEVDAGELIDLRDSTKAVAEARGVKLTFLPFIVQAVVAALKRYPIVNSFLDEEKGEIVIRRAYHIGIAVQTEQGLTVPVVKNADRLTPFELAAEMERLSDAARAGRAKLEELTGSTFTITSLGKTGGLLATPVVNYPETAIMGVHAIKEKPVVRDGRVVPGKVMNLSFTFDHRVIDGAVGAEFAQLIVRYLEDPKLLLLENL